MNILATPHHHGDPNKPCRAENCGIGMTYPGAKIDVTLRDRGKEYGDFGQMAYLAQRIKDAMREGSSWDNMGEEKRESLDMIATKIARLVCGNCDLKDSWHDIAGYAKLAEDRCPVPKTPAPTFSQCTCTAALVGLPHAPGCPEATP